MLDKYSNSNDIIKSTSNVDAQRIEELDKELLIPQTYALNGLPTDKRDNFELHVYAPDGTWVTGNHNVPAVVSTNEFLGKDQLPPYNIEFNIKTELNKLNIKRGQYKILVNFFETILGNLDDKNVWVKEISPSRREVRVSINRAYLPQLQQLLDIRYQYHLNNLVLPLVLNFGKNNVYPIVNFKLEPVYDLSEVIRDSVPATYITKFPGQTEANIIREFAYTFGPEGTLVRNSDNLSDYYIIQNNVYRWFGYNESLLFEFAKYLDKSRFSNDGKEIRRAYPYLIDNGYGTMIPNFIENPNYQLNGDGDNPGVPKGPDVTLTDLVGTDEYVNVVFRLYQPLDASIGEKAKAFISQEYRSPYTDTVLLIDKSVPIEFNKLRPADFSVPAYEYQSIPTDYKTWNDLLDTNLSTSQKIIDNYFSGSLQGVPLNINYAEFENFVHFSSAVERVKNFKYKLELVEYYTDRINALSGSIITNLNPLYTKRNAIVSSFDGFEKYLFYESGSQQLYTHVSYSISPWPKLASSNDPLDPYDSFTKLYRITQSIAEDYYNDLLDQALVYDNFNVHRLLKTMPYHIRSADDSEQFSLFIDMLGHHYDIVWTYMKHMTKIYSREEHPKDGMSNDLLYHAAKSLGFQLYNGRSTTELWKYAFGVDNSGSLAQNGENGIYSLPEDQVTKEYWRRLLNNLPYLLKTKGTERSIKALLSCFGIPSTLLTIKEFGGPTTFTTETDFYPEFVHDKFVFAYKTNTPGYKNYLQLLPANDSGQGFSKNVNALEFTFRTDDEVVYIPGVEYNIFTYDSSIDFYNSSSVDAITPDLVVSIKKESATDNEGTIYLRIDGETPVSMSNTYVFDNGFNLMYLYNDGSDISLTYTKAKYGKIIQTGSVSITSNVLFDDINANTLGAARWGNPGTASINSINISPFSGHFQEIRLWSGSLNEQTLFEHALSPNTYTYNVNRGALTGNEALEPYNRLVQRHTLTNKNVGVLTASFASPTTSDSFTRTYQITSHPNQTKDAYRFSDFTGTQLGGGVWLVNVSGSSQISEVFDGFDETYYTPSPSLGGNSLYTNKVRIESNQLTGFLSPTKRVEFSSFDKFSNDSSKVGIYFSPQDAINEDIFNQLGYYEIDDYIGDPGAVYTENYPDLEDFASDYWKKYNNKNDFEAFFRALSIYDMSIFKYIKDMIPYRSNAVTGFLIEPNALERKRFRTTKPSVDSAHMFDGLISGEETSLATLQGAFPVYDAVIDDTHPITLGDYLSNHIGEIDAIQEVTVGGEYKSSVGEIDYDFNIDKLGTAWVSGSKIWSENKYVGAYKVGGRSYPPVIQSGSYTPIQTVITTGRYDIIEPETTVLSFSASLNGLTFTYGNLTDAAYFIAVPFHGVPS